MVKFDLTSMVYFPLSMNDMTKTEIVSLIAKLILYF